MKYLRSIDPKKMIAIGLLMVVLPTLFKDYVPVPEFVSGFLVGLGLGLEIIGVIMQRKEKKGEQCGVAAE